MYRIQTKQNYQYNSEISLREIKTALKSSMNALE